MPSKEFQNRPGSVWERYSFDGKPFDVIRKEMEELAIAGVKTYPDVTWEEGNAGTICGKWIRPAEPNGKLIYYVHGGGFTTGSSGIPLPFLMEVAHRLGVTCFSADYRLAPEEPFPAAPEDVYAGYLALLDMGYAPGDMILSGESAGGTLVLDVPLLAKRDGVPVPAGIVAMSPVTDMTQVLNETVLEGLDDPDELFKIYAPGYDKADPIVSPALGDLKDYPVTFLIAGGAETLMQDTLIFATAAAKAGNDVRIHIGKDMIHTYPLDFWDYPEAMTAFEEIVLFIRQILAL